MDNLQSSLQNALEIANIDFKVIFDFINNGGSIEDYSNNAKKLGKDFEKELVLKVLESTPEQIKSFADININKIDSAIQQINIIKDFHLKSKSQIDNDFYNKEMFEELINPVIEIHYAELSYIRRALLKIVDNSDKTSTIDHEPVKSNKETECKYAENAITDDSLLSKYGEFLNMKNMEEIFNVRRNTIYRWENEGRFNRCSLSKGHVLFNKKDIIAYLNRNK